MYTCICFAVTEARVRSEIDAGASSLDAVTDSCGAGGGCGSCHRRITALLPPRRSA